MIELNNNYFAVEVPDGANSFQLYKAPRSWDHLTWYQGKASFGAIRSAELPPGDWEIICVFKKLTYAEASDMVEHNGLSFRDYLEDYPAYGLSPLESVDSLLTSKGCDLNKTYLIVKKQ
jgi:hypothetical protein